MDDSDLRQLFKLGTPLIDVRAPIEFAAGAVPNSVNLPILNTHERTLVGTCYKEQGPAAAELLGHSLVSGGVKDQRISAWKNFLMTHPEAKLFCFRGGLRSQFSCQWLRQAGLEIYPLPGGYKRLRNLLIAELAKVEALSFLRLGGLTGSGKTKILEEVPFALDLEALAQHRGSTFGRYVSEQPTQVTFENAVGARLISLTGPSILIEDESAMIGKLQVPKKLFQRMKVSPMILLEVSMEERIKNIFEEYVACGPEAVSAKRDFFLAGADQISRRLGGQRHQELRREMTRAFSSPMAAEVHAPWIEYLLVHYYDPFYAKDMLKHAHLVAFRGNHREVQEYLGALARSV